ncbi:MAG: hypothetical protein IJ679_02355 [Lachnospiraceae bacterium]|nr:hypothetical protein [Lachnospiraceae bacterium]
MNTKPIPIILTLSAAGVSCFISVLQEVAFPTFVLRLLLTVVFFYIVGIVVGILLFNAFPPPAKIVASAVAAETDAALQDNPEGMDEEAAEGTEDSEGEALSEANEDEAAPQEADAPEEISAEEMTEPSEEASEAPEAPNAEAPEESPAEDA